VEPVEYRGTNYEETYGLLRHVHLPRLAGIEALYLTAVQAARTEGERRRLQMFADNLIVFHYHLRKAGLIEAPDQSTFYRSDADFAAFLRQNQGSLAIHSDKKGQTAIRAIWAPETRRLQIPRRPAGGPAPSIDGELQPTEWQDAAVADSFRLVSRRDPPAQPTSVRVMVDDTCLYIAFECREEKGKPIAGNAWERDNGRKIFGQNTVEVFLTPAGMPSSQCWHLVVNPKNSRWDGLGADSTPDLDGWQSATKVEDGRWVAEIAVPFKALGLPAPPGRVWRGNFGRGRGEIPHGEYSTWNSVEAGFNDPSSFGEWVFDAAPAR